MSNASDGARIKVWPGATPGSNVTNAGGGVGLVRNVTYNGMHDLADDCEPAPSFSYRTLLTEHIDAIELTQCYGQSNLTLCNLHPVSAKPDIHETGSLKLCFGPLLISLNLSH